MHHLKFKTILGWAGIFFAAILAYYCMRQDIGMYDRFSSGGIANGYHSYTLFHLSDITRNLFQQDAWVHLAQIPIVYFFLSVVTKTIGISSAVIIYQWFCGFASMIVVYALASKKLGEALAALIVLIFSFSLAIFAMTQYSHMSFFVALLFLSLHLFFYDKMRFYLSLLTLFLAVNTSVYISFICIIGVGYSFIDKRSVKWALPGLVFCSFTIGAAALGLVDIASIMKMEPLWMILLTYGVYSLIRGVYRIAFVTKAKKTKIALSFSLAIISFFLGSSFVWAQVHRGQLMPSYLPQNYEVLQDMVGRIPKNSTVATTPTFAGKLATYNKLYVVGHDQAKRLSGMHGNFSNKSAEADYLLIDLNRDIFHVSENVQKRVESSANGNYQKRKTVSPWSLIESMGATALFSTSQKSGFDKSLFSSYAESQENPYMLFNAVASNSIEFIGFTMYPHVSYADVVMFDYFFKKIGNMEEAIELELILYSEKGNVVYTEIIPLCYNLYPFQEWTQGEKVKQTYAFAIPDHLSEKSYEVHLGIRNRQTKEVYKFNSPYEDALHETGFAKLIILDAAT